jgi:hypothetical protein
MSAAITKNVRGLFRSNVAATMVEFAVVAPIFFGVLFFIFDMGYMLYAQSILNGEVKSVGRASTLETATDENREAMDEELAADVRKVVPHGEFTFQRTSFNNYGLAQARVEPFVDVNGDSICNSGENFLDLNGNGQYDLDGGRAGGGGARDVVIYTVTLSYDRLFPVAGLFGLSPQVQLQSQTLLKNQPFDLQSQPSTRVCS